ncbi:MAG TPA: hypothetical protein VE868_03395 [Balneolaceae bacterium]|nr:hypothetical protein [Balneolaceae bacterium]
MYRGSEKNFKDVEQAEKKLIEDRSELIDEVYEQIGYPLSVWAVAATIESLGIRDVDAVEDFGFESVFDLSGEIYKDLKKRVKNEYGGADHIEKFEKKPLVKRIWTFTKFYAKGLMFSLPMLSQVAAILIFKYSMWAWLRFNAAQATAVALGTIAAFVVTGGFTQALGRSVTKFVGEKNYLLAFKATKKILKTGFLTMVDVALGLYLLNIIIPFYPQEMLVLALMYYLLISALLLASGVLYAFEQRAVILLFIVAGTGVVIAGMELFHLGIYLSQGAGLLVSLMLFTIYYNIYFYIKLRTNQPSTKNQSLPATGILHFINYRYFIYGFVFFLFLFLDRLLAWSAGPPPPAYIIWFNTPYELGMDWALLSLFLTVAVLEYSVNMFSRRLMTLQKTAWFNQTDVYNTYFKKFYHRQLLLIGVVGIGSIIAAYFGINSLRVFRYRIPEIRDFFANPMTIRVYWIASVGYLFFVIGLLHSLFFFRLHKPKYAMYSIIGATLADFLVGFICSRIFGLEYATVGLLAGALTFALISRNIAKSFFEHLDYHYYSAF